MPSYTALWKLSRYSDTGPEDKIFWLSTDIHTNFQPLQPTERKLLDSRGHLLREKAEQPVSGAKALSLFFVYIPVPIPHRMPPKAYSLPYWPSLHKKIGVAPVTVIPENWFPLEDKHHIQNSTFDFINSRQKEQIPCKFIFKAKYLTQNQMDRWGLVQAMASL